MSSLSFSLRVWCAFVLAVSAYASAAQDAQIAPSTAQSIRTVIESQLQAFQRDDAVKAFSFASESIRKMFVTPDNFIEMVKSAYPVVYRPASVEFLVPKRAGEAVMQPVRMNDESGKAWTAVYRMEPQADGGWLISGCVLAKVLGEEI